MEIVNVAYVVMAVAISLILYKMIFNPDGAASISLQNKMVSLNPIKGKSYSEIVTIVGTPTVTEIRSDGKMCSWNTQKYAINLGFDMDGICTGVFGEKIIK